MDYDDNYVVLGLHKVGRHLARVGVRLQWAIILIGVGGVFHYSPRYAAFLHPVIYFQPWL